MEKKHKDLMDGIYVICKAFMAIVEFECCDYGFRDEVEMAELYIKHYEAAHPDYEAEDTNG